MDTSKRLVQDEEYYRYIFKKTEKIVSVVFYILYNTANDSRTASHIEDIQHAARHVHDAILQSLETRIVAAEDPVRATALALIGLESKLRVAHTAGIVTAEIMHVLASEIDTVLRGMSKYLKQDNGLEDEDPDGALGSFVRNDAPQRRQQRRPGSVTSTAPSSAASGGEKVDRRDRIKTVLAAHGNASIKDIAAVISDVSEKTIQRELNAMIEDNSVQRHGERRWSTYTLS